MLAVVVGNEELRFYIVSAWHRSPGWQFWGWSMGRAVTKGCLVKYNVRVFDKKLASSKASLSKLEDTQVNLNTKSSLWILINVVSRDSART